MVEAGSGRDELMQTLVVPPTARASVLALLSGTGWELEVAGVGGATDLDGTLRLGAPGRGVVFVPPGATVAGSVRRVAVLHGGSPASSQAVEAADHIAVSTGAEVVVVHVPDAEAPSEPGSLTTMRVADHGPYDWPQWRDEFLRRLCPVSPGVSLTLELPSGPPVVAILDVVSRVGADLVVAAWKGSLDPGRAQTLRGVATRSPCPVVILRLPGSVEERARPAGLSDLDGVIFDMDGVVTETATVHAAAWKKLFDEYLLARSGRTGEAFVPFERRDYLRYVDGRNRYDGVASFLASRGITLPRGDADDPPGRDTVYGLGNRKDEYFLARLHDEGARAYETTVRLIRDLRAKGVRTAVVTASRNAAEVLAAAGVADLFDEKVDGVDAAELGLPGKPDPATFLEAARRLGVEPARAAVAEDALAGVEAGRRGGFGLVVGVDRSGLGSALADAGADVVVSDLGELPA
jgi:beta-phosphoglucomutase family hydrolase